MCSHWMLHVSLVVHTIFVSRYYYRKKVKRERARVKYHRGEIMKKTYNYMMTYADCTKMMLVKPRLVFHL